MPLLLLSVVVIISGTYKEIIWNGGKIAKGDFWKSGLSVCGVHGSGINRILLAKMPNRRELDSIDIVRNPSF